MLGEEVERAIVDAWRSGTCGRTGVWAYGRN